MYVPSSQACDVPNGSVVPTAQLAAAAAATAADALAITNAQGAFESTLVRSPADFTCMGAGVVVDVAAVNKETNAAQGGPYAAAMMAGYPGKSCDGSSSGGCNVVPLNGPGSTSLPQVNAQPAPLRIAPISPAGLGRIRDMRRHPSRVRVVRPRGLGCTDLPAWGDAFPAGGPLLTPTQSILGWTAANPLLTLGIAAAALWIASSAQKGKRG